MNNAYHFLTCFLIILCNPHRRSRSGEWIEHKTPIGTYFCPQPHKELRHTTCPKTVSAKQAESQVWEKVSQFITKARKERMPDEEFTPQIGEHYDRELRIQRKLTAIEQAKDAFTKLDVEEQVKKYVGDLQLEMAELIHIDPQTPDKKHQLFLLKKWIVDAVLAEVRIDENRESNIKFRTDFLNYAR